MSHQFMTRLELQLREAAEREERRGPLATRVVRTRRRLPEAPPVAVTAAVVLLAVAVALAVGLARRAPAPAGPRIDGVYRIGAGLDSLSPGSGALWTADTVGGQVVRIDPATRHAVARIPVHGDAVVAARGGAVWALAGDLLHGGDDGGIRLLRIDPASNRVTARVALRRPGGGGFGPLELAVERGSVWVIGVEGVLRVDARRGVPDRFVALSPAVGRGAVPIGERVFSLLADGRLRTLDARTGRVLRTVRVTLTPDTRLAPGPAGTLTLVAGRTLTAINRVTGHRRWRADAGGDVRRFLIDGAHLWVGTARAPDAPDQLVELSASTGHRVAAVDLPRAGVTGLARQGRDVWVATSGGELLVVHPGDAR